MPSLTKKALQIANKLRYLTQMSELNGIYRIKIRKEALKFSAAHMTVFADGTKENLHGHNYRTELNVVFENFSLREMLPFSELKQAMREICDEWDEMILLPERCEFIKVIEKSGASIEILACGKKYVFPSDETLFLPTDNVTTESLAQIFCHRVIASLSQSNLARAKVRSVEVLIEEITGQGASYVITF